jgi:ribonuclease P protein component
MSVRRKSSFRLTGDRYHAVFDANESYRSRTVVMFVRRGGDAGRKAGVVVSKKTFPLAVDRNRAKRLMREAFRLNRDRLVSGVEVVLIARGFMNGKSMQDVAGDIRYLFRKSGIEAPREE